MRVQGAAWLLGGEGGDPGGWVGGVGGAQQSPASALSSPALPFLSPGGRYNSQPHSNPGLPAALFYPSSTLSVGCMSRVFTALLPYSILDMSLIELDHFSLNELSHSERLCILPKFPLEVSIFNF